ncbi:MAG: V-type ATP synthase subunit I [Clostridia bacterium]|nr:V-type ATP synthase subunit I [Clostridia bacterium]
MIAPMKKVSIVCMREDREKVLKALQHSALMMIEVSDTGVMGDDRESGEHQRRVEQLLRELNKYKEKKGLFAQPTEVNESSFDTLSDDTISLCNSIENLIKKRDELVSEEASLQSITDTLRDWAELKALAQDLKQTESTDVMTVRLPVAKYPLLEERIADLDASFEKVSVNEKTVQLLIVCMKEACHSLRALLSECEAEEIKLPIVSGKIADKLSETNKRLLEVSDEKNAINEQLEASAKSSTADVETLFEQYRASADRAEVRLSETVETVFIEGWVRADCMDKLKSTIEEATPIFDVESRDPKEDEEVPTSLQNSKLVSQFEGITEMFNPPKYNDYDPNAVMAPWYWIIFGMMMGDAGYGLMMAVLIFLGKKLMKPRGGTAKLMNVLLYSSVTTIFFGILFGSYFGEELFPPLIGFTSMSDPIKMLILTLVVGVLHIFTGMITKIVLNVRSGNVLDAIFDQVSWMMIIAGLGMIFIPPLSKVGPIIAIIGALIVLFTAGRAKKGIVGKITGGLGGLYNITSYLSDILSYSRILALGLATGVVGYVMNMLAGMVQNGVIGFILSLLIYIVGHVFNLVLGLLSAYVHSCRLQYIEFYGKFYEGGGTVFKPFGIRTNYINIKKD